MHYATLPSTGGKAASSAPLLADPSTYVHLLDKSQVRIVETFNEVTASMPRAKRREFQLANKLDSASPARWPFEALMLACATFNIPPTLGVGGTEEMLHVHGFKPGTFRSVKSLEDQMAMVEDGSATLVDEDFDDEEDSPSVDVSSDAFDPNWFENFFGIEDTGVPSTSAAGGSAPEATKSPSASPSFFIEPQLDENFVISDSTKRLLRTVDNLSKTEIVNVALTGPTGTGKTSLPEWFAAKTNRPFFIFDTPTIREPKEALGFKDLSVDAATGETRIIWQKSGLIQALETPGCVVVLDEVTRVHGSYMNALLALLDHRKRVWLDEIQDTVQVADGVIIFFTANIGSTYTGTWTWDAAFENRIDFRIDIDYLRPDAEAEVLVAKTGLDGKVAKAFAEIAQIIRARAQDPGDSISKAVSTRQLLAASKAVRIGLSPNEALEYTIVPTYSADGGQESDRAHILQIIQGKLAA